MIPTEEVIAAIWERAKSQPIGCAVEVHVKDDLRAIRNLFYAVRNKLKDPELDSFSVILPGETGEVWIMPKELADARAL